MTDLVHSQGLVPGGDEAGGAGHTPGPWGIFALNVRNDGRIILAGDYGICTAWDTNGAPENEANARLIAAAPDAFGLAVDFIDWVDKFTGTLPEAQSDAMFDLYARARRIYLTVDEKGHDASRASLIAKAVGDVKRDADPIHRRDGDAESGGVNQAKTQPQEPA